ncbi:MAG: hypothetical protein JSS41_11115 [Proteobacteria bacterium]|nr:hypothetical protein [Pseudomonadota bacterium]
MSRGSLWIVWVEKLGALDTTALAALCVLAALARRDGWLAVRYAAVLVAAMALGVVSKMAYYGWGVRFGLGPFHGMSGHVLRAFAVWPALGFALMAGRSRAAQVTAVAAGALVALGVTVMIVHTRVHSPAEAIAGGAAGWLASAWLLRHEGLARLGWPCWLPLAIVAVLGCGWIARYPLTDYDFETRLSIIARQIRNWSGAPPCKVRHGLVECDQAPAPHPDDRY